MVAEIEKILRETDHEFFPSLSSFINIHDYAEKISKNATVFFMYENSQMQAFIAFYNNDIVSKTAFLTMIIVKKEARKKGIAKMLLENAISYLKNNNFKKFTLEVEPENNTAISLYEKLGFLYVQKNKNKNVMELNLKV